MKSVVVEASTVAKAIEAAWLKADRPEEFFIRILQEHSSGFLGFGAQKAKVVFFFKNSHKSDSLFPVVVKQKEYASFFGNSNFKVPAELNVVDSELNKNVSLGGQHKKKPHNNQSNQNSQQKAKQNNPQPDLSGRSSLSAKTDVRSHAKVAVHKISQERSVDTAVHADKQVNKQVKVQHNAPKQLSQDKALANDAAVNKVLQSAPHKMQVSLQAPSFVKVAADKKEDVVKDVANALKKIQSQKIVANVSRNAQSAHDKSLVKPDEALLLRSESSGAHVAKTTANVSSPKKPVHNKQVTAKFESYEDFINSTTGIPAEKESVAAKAEKIEVVESLHKFLDHDKSAMNAVNDVATTVKEEVAPVTLQPSKPTSTTPRAPLKFKRRPLTTENSGVSGIVRSVKTVEEAMDTAVEDANNLDEKK